ncbi:CopD family protein [Danxiaibacter flavus]|uniref:Protoporphyrinogen IX oxidase n=1 Tax=Danxiaibacter flavus TaxID=3049108 RepID=A0ABV3Z7P0_9BACT|nr:CopD family protein [Chitinophagaceae bacterium DXS]
MYNYLKALHIIFVVTWFAGMFYMPRFFIYATEAAEKDEVEKNILREQFKVMMKRLWLGITWPSAILTLIFGPVVMAVGNWDKTLFTEGGRWLLIKLILVVLLYVYHFSLHRIYKEEMNGIFKYTSQQLRIWNEVATILLVAIVFLAVVKTSLSMIWGLLGLILFIIILMSAIKIYKILREGKKK